MPDSLGGGGDGGSSGSGPGSGGSGGTGTHTPPPPSNYQMFNIPAALAASNAKSVPISASTANSIVNAFYKGSAEPSFDTSLNVLETTWTSQLNASLNAGGSLSSLASNPNTLVRFSTSAASAASGAFWTPIGQVVDSDGNLLSASDIQQILALPNTPTFMAYGGQFPAGSQVLSGVAAANSYGSGGGFQLFCQQLGTAAEGAVDEISSIAGELGPLDRTRSNDVVRLMK